MKLFDTSSIINLCGNGREGLLYSEYTLPLAIYEVGNAIWRQVYISKAITLDEGIKTLDAVVGVFETMKKIAPEDPVEVLKLAVTEGLTYYDAAYFYTAMKDNLTLVTDDARLQKAAGGHITIINSDEAKEKM